MSEPKYYRIDLEVNGGIGFWVTREGNPKLVDTPKEVADRHITEGASVDLPGAFGAIASVLYADMDGKPRTSEPRFSGPVEFSGAERALLAYGLGLAKGIAEPEMLRDLLAKLGVNVEEHGITFPEMKG